MNSTVTIYHGSEKIIEKPVFGEGKRHNDFGPGFYCTENEDLAKEWAVTKNRNGYVNKYSLNTECLNILYLNSEQYTILNWIATLVNNRVFTLNNPVTNRARRYIIDNFSVNVNAYDLIIGYRADDSYFDYAQAFLNNTITIEQLSLAMKLGKLGEQIVLKSRLSFEQLSFVNYREAESELYYPLRKKRDEDANNYYLKILEKEEDGLYIQDIIRGGILNDDPRIPRNIS